MCYAQRRIAQRTAPKGETMLDQIFAIFKPTQTVYLATMEDDQPYVRPVTLIYYQNRWFIATGSSDAKSRQLNNHPKLEFCLPLSDPTGGGYIRGIGISNSVTDLFTKKEVAEHAPFLYDYWNDVDNPDMVLYEIRIKSFAYLKPGDMLANKITLN